MFDPADDAEAPEPRASSEGDPAEGPELTVMSVEDEKAARRRRAAQRSRKRVPYHPT